MQSLRGHSGPRQYLNAQFTFSRSELTSKVLRSALVGMRVYYAAIEHVRHEKNDRSVFAAVCLVRYNPRDREGYIFGYKDMDETLGPNESNCPEAILDQFTPTGYPYAQAWRVRCRENAAARRALSRKPSPRPGQTIVLDQPLSFRDGCTLDSRLYRITSVKKHSYRLIDLG
ncbi:MAG: hypothetical protein AB7S93_24040 [Xanthobacteraceae bacterium]